MWRCVIVVFCVLTLGLILDTQAVPYLTLLSDSDGESQVNNSIEPKLGENVEEQAEVNKENNIIADPNIEIIEKLVNDLPLDRFLDDPVLLQKIDRVNSITSYNLPQDNTTVIYMRQTADTKKETVVLLQSEDNLLVNGNNTKRTYVVLKRVPKESKPYFYFLFFAYIRDATIENTKSIPIDGTRSTVEFDSWSERSTPSREKLLGWHDCSSTIFFSCAVNNGDIEAIARLANLTANSKNDTNVTETLSNGTTKQSLIEISTEKPAKSKPAIVSGIDGFDFREFYDFFQDLDAEIPTLARTMGGRSGSCGLFSSFIGCKSNKAEVKHEATPTVGKGIASVMNPPYVPSPIGVQTVPSPSRVQTVPSPSGVQTPNAPGGGKPGQFYGAFFESFPSSPGVFIPSLTSIPVLFVSDYGDIEAMPIIHGMLAAGSTPNFPMEFTPDNINMLNGITFIKGTFVPDGMTDIDISGGIHGTLSNQATRGLFVTDIISKLMWLDPTTSNPSRVWYPQNLVQINSQNSMRSPEGISGMFYTGLPGASGSPNIFIPDGQGVPGFFVPNDPRQPQVDNFIAHGIFYADRISGMASFYPDIRGSLINFANVRGAFMPDNMNMTGAISGVLSGSPTYASMLVDNPGRPWVYVMGQKETEGVWAPFLNRRQGIKFNPTVAPSRDALIIGTMYSGDDNIMVFIPDGINNKGQFIPTDSRSPPLDGDFFPDVPYNRILFTPDEPVLVSRVTNAGGKIYIQTISEMNRGAMSPGIPGGLTSAGPYKANATFIPNILGRKFSFNPTLPGNAGVWTPFQSVPSTTPAPIVKQVTPAFVYGVFYAGSGSGSSSHGIFIPESTVSIPGVIIPDSPDYPQIVGDFIAGKPGMIPNFTPANSTTSVVQPSSVHGVYFPFESSDPNQGVRGTYVSGTGGQTSTFIPDLPSKAYWYIPGRPENHDIWTPYMDGVSPPTEKPLVLPNTAETAVQPTQAASPSVYGLYFEGSAGSHSIFLPDGEGVGGIIIPDNPDHPQVHGLFYAGRPGSPGKFDVEGSVDTSNMQDVPCVFIPDGVSGSVSQGIRGTFSSANGVETATFTSSVAGKSWWYVSGRPESQNIWTPFASNIPAAAPIYLPVYMKGVYHKGNAGSESIFISDDGTNGYLIPDSMPGTKISGILYGGTDSNFVADSSSSNSLFNGTFATFHPDDGASEGFHGTFYEGTPTNAPKFMADNAGTSGWTTSTQNQSATHAFHYENSMWTNLVKANGTLKKVGVDVGGGYKGYPTNGNGFDDVIDPNSPIFKEFIAWKVRQPGTSIDPANIVLINSDSDKSYYNSNQQSTSSYIYTNEVRTFIEERYTIKRTHVITTQVDEYVELVVPKAAEKFIKKKPKKYKINVNLNSNADASGGAGAGAGGTSGGKASGGVSAKIGNCKPIDTSASSQAFAKNGSTSNAKAHAANGGNAVAKSNALNGGDSTSNANVQDGGKATAVSNSGNGGKANSAANSITGGEASALSNSFKVHDKALLAESTAIAGKKPGQLSLDNCGEDGFPEEIVVDSTAVSQAIAGNGTGSATSTATTSVKIDMAGLVAKLMSQMEANGNYDDDEEGPEINIDINANALANAQAGRSLSTGMKRSNLPTDLLHPCWKTEFLIPIAPNDTFVHENDIFYGLGSCPYKKVAYQDLLQASKPEDIINFYMTILRTECATKAKLRLVMLLMDGLLEFADKVLHIPANHVYLSQTKLTVLEISRFSKAFEFSMFTKTYVVIAGEPTASSIIPVSPSGRQISRSINFITYMSLSSIDEARVCCKNHFVHLTRNLVTTLRTVLTKLNQDRKELEKCPECTFDKRINANDRFQVVSLLQFVFLSPHIRGDQDIQKLFQNFYVKNIEGIQVKVETSFLLL